jgi:serine/threonine protein kinase
VVFRFDPQNWKLVLVKVTDYGLSLMAHKGFTEGASVIEVATMSSNAAGPTRWMAPVSIMRRSYSKKSDVWSFGVVLYEVWTLGMIPYHLIADDKEAARLVTQGDNCRNQATVRSKCMQSCRIAGRALKRIGQVCRNSRQHCKRCLRRFCFCKNN